MESPETRKNPEVVEVVSGDRPDAALQPQQRAALLAAGGLPVLNDLPALVADRHRHVLGVRSSSRRTLPDFWYLGRATITGISIFEYPWQIVVLGLLMGILAIVPVLIAQLMSFGHSFIFMLAVFFLANLPGFALCSVRELLCGGVPAAAIPIPHHRDCPVHGPATSLLGGVFGAARGANRSNGASLLPRGSGPGSSGMTVAGLVLGHRTLHAVQART